MARSAYTAKMSTPRAFADFCCELLSGLGPVLSKRMFGGWGLSVDGLTVALLADMGHGDTLYLKADADSRTQFEAAGCRRFMVDTGKDHQTVQRSLNYYSAPEAAMDSPDAMLPWARLALQSALSARAGKPSGGAKPRKTVARKVAPGRRARP